MKFCCFTGHRTIADEEVSAADTAISIEVDKAMKCGYQHFLCGFADGADLLFAEWVAQAIRRQSAIHLYAALPNRARERALRKNSKTRELLELCDEIYVATEGSHPGMYAKRNQYMVEHSQRVIALYDGGEKGGTAFTVRLAKKLHRELYVIPYPTRMPVEKWKLPDCSIHDSSQKQPE